MYRFRWHNMPNQRIMAKFDVTQGLTYVVNFVHSGEDRYDCFSYPSVASTNNGIKMLDIRKVDNRQIQQKIYLTLMEILKEFADKYNPEEITFTTQFQNQLSRISSSTVSGYAVEYSSGGQIKLKKVN